MPVDATGNDRKLFEIYLSKRHQFVSCGSVESDWCSITHGVPRGSVLRQTLFNIHINGISSASHNSDIMLYADEPEIHANSKEIDTAKQYVNQEFDRIDA